MKLISLAALVTAALAAPVPAGELAQQPSCGPSFVFARGSTEPSPIGIIIGPSLQSSLKYYFPNMITYPVYYAASLATNVRPERTDPESMAKGVEAFEKAYAACPSGIIIAGGYSQGAAVMHNVVESKLKPEIKARIAGVALFGDTRNKQDKGHILNFPNERSKVWCNAGDGVCGGELNVNGAHLAYGYNQMSEAATWLNGLVKSFR